LRKVLVVGQFTISISLLIGTMIVYRQVNYMKTKDLGFEKEQKMFFPLGERIMRTIGYEGIKTEFLKLPGVNGATVSSGIPGFGISGWQTRILGVTDDRQQLVDFFFVDPDFIQEFKMEMAAGRAFRKDMTGDMNNTYIINEAAVKAFGWTTPEEAFKHQLTTSTITGPIIGIVRDFHIRGVQTQIAPLALIYSPRSFNIITLTVGTENLDNTISQIKKKYSDLYPDGLFTHRFVDEVFDNRYMAEERTGKLFSTFTFLGIFISCLGLFGLASYTAETRSKEIGIRKVLGATIPEVVFLLQKEFIKWVAAAIFIAIPVGYFLMNRWLENFAYRVDTGLWAFVFASVIALIISVLTVSFQTIKAAARNPAHSLRYE